MTDTLFWIEWLDRLERSVDAATQDATALVRVVSEGTLARLSTSGRHFSALHKELLNLDPRVITSLPDGQAGLRVQAIAQLLESINLQIGRTTEWTPATPVSERTRLLASVDGLLRDCRYQTLLLIGAKRSSPTVRYQAGTAVTQALQPTI